MFFQNFGCAFWEKLVFGEEMKQGSWKVSKREVTGEAWNVDIIISTSRIWKYSTQSWSWPILNGIWAVWGWRRSYKLMVSYCSATYWDIDGPGPSLWNLRTAKYRFLSQDYHKYVMSEVAFVTFLIAYFTTRRSEQNVEFKVSTRVCDENAQSHKLAGDTVSTALFLFQIRKYIISNAIFKKCVLQPLAVRTPLLISQKTWLQRTKPLHRV